MFTSPFQNQTLYIMHTQHVYWINKHQYLKSFPGLNMIIGSSNFNNQAPPKLTSYLLSLGYLRNWEELSIFLFAFIFQTQLSLQVSMILSPK